MVDNVSNNFDAIKDDENTKIITLMRDPDVLDTWFSSGLWPFGTLGWPDKSKELERYYTSNNLNRTLITGFDIIFFWGCSDDDDGH